MSGGGRRDLTDEREERIGKNEILLREVNEQIEELDQRLTRTVDRIDFVCECGRTECARPVRLDLDEYERVRANAHQFVTLPGHETPAVERVIARCDRFQVVEKDSGEPAELVGERRLRLCAGREGRHERSVQEGGEVAKGGRQE
jgi:hypothetical protein